MRKFKSVLALLLALVLVLGCVGTAFAAKTPVSELEGASKGDAADAKGFKSVEFQANLNKYNDDDVVRAIVVLKDAPTAALAKRGAANEAAVREQVKASQEKVRKAMRGIDYEVQYTYDTLLNGFSCDVAYGDLDKIASIDGVDAVYIANHYDVPVLEKSMETKTIGSSYMTGSGDAAYEYGVNGSGIVVAVLDTGLNTTHEAFQDADGTCAATGRLTADDAALAVADGKYVNAKIPFAYDYADKDNDVTDSQGHGTHVSGIIAGSTYDEAEGAYTFTGAAPGAQIVSMKIFKDGVSGTSSDIYFYALEDAYRLGVDVVNMSIGAQNGFTYDASLETEVFGNIYKRLSAAGIILSVAAGNEYSMAEYSSVGYIGPEYQDYGTVASPSTYIGSTSVAAVENYCYPAYTISVNGESFEYTDTCELEDKTWLNVFGGKETEYVIVKDTTGKNKVSELSLGAPADFEAVDVKGKIAVIQRGDSTFSEKVVNAAAAGASGVIVVNNQSGVIRMSIDDFKIPAIAVPLSAQDTFLNAETKVVSTSTEQTLVENANYGLMDDFSNWGTSPMLTMAPAVTSVGGNVYSSVNTGNQDYEIYSGTSMAAPNFAGSVALVLQYLNENADSGLTKVEKSERALALLEGTATALADSDGYAYSVRKQGAGLANAYDAISTYDVSAYILNPLQELGDDAEKTGSYTFDLELVNDNADYVSYLQPSSLLTYDYVYNYYKNDPSKDPLYMNTLTEDHLSEGDDYEITYTINGEEVDGVIAMEPGTTCTVTVEIKLSADVKAYFDRMFENGNYVDGFVWFDDIEVDQYNAPIFYDADDNAYRYDEETKAFYASEYDRQGEWSFVLKDGNKVACDEETLGELAMNVYNSVHATMLAFYGDWTKGDILEKEDFTDFIEANNFVNTTVVNAAGNTYADYGYTAYDLLNVYTDANMAYTAVFSSAGMPQKLRYYLGDNLMDYADYFAAHNAFSTLDTDADGIYANGMYITPYQLRNCKSLKMTVSDAETGEVYYVDDTPYLGKAYYDDDYGWQAEGAFYWTGKDTSGDFVPSGTVANVVFDAVLPYGDTEVNNIWSFQVEVDYTAPVVESAVFDPEAKTLTVTASDESYLAAIYLYDSSLEDYPSEAFSSDQEGKSFTATFDVAELIDAGLTEITVCALDYATNETEATAALYEVGKDATITYITPNNTKTVAVKTGDAYTIEGCTESYDDAQFVCWVDQEVEDASEWGIYDAVSAMYFEDDEITVGGNMTVYALYAYGEEVTLDVPNYYYDVRMDYSGEWAICGLDYVSGEGYDTSNPKALNEAGETKSVKDELGGTIGSYYTEFYVAEDGIRFSFERDADGSYTVKNAKSGKYMAVVSGELAFIDEPTDAAKWEITSDLDSNGAVIRSAQNAKWVLVYNDDEGEFQVLDDTVAISSFFGLSIRASDYYLNWLYCYSDTELEVTGYTTAPSGDCKHNGATELRDAKEATEDTDGYTGDLYCSICGDLIQKGEVIPATGYPTCYFKTFKDCMSEWYHEAVDFAVANDLMKGVAADSFDPDGTMTRAMMVTVLYRMAGSPEVKGNSTFTDVPAGQWYSDAIAWAQDNGIVLGVLTDKFAPNDFVTREQIATILWRYEGKPAAESKFDGFKDADKISDYAKEAMAWAVSEGIFNGDNGNLKPTDNATRAEFACIVMRYLDGSYACKDLEK